MLLRCRASHDERGAMLEGLCAQVLGRVVPKLQVPGALWRQGDRDNDWVCPVCPNLVAVPHNLSLARRVLVHEARCHRRQPCLSEQLVQAIPNVPQRPRPRLWPQKEANIGKTAPFVADVARQAFLRPEVIHFALPRHAVPAGQEEACGGRFVEKAGEVRDESVLSIVARTDKHLTEAGADARLAS